jgi:hypothetical protein
MKNKIAGSVIVLALACLLGRSWGTDKSQTRKIHRENIEWCDAWMPDSNSTGSPRVLLIGDSITRGYFPKAQTLLKGKAYCARFCTTKAVGDPALATELSVFLSESNYMT